MIWSYLAIAFMSLPAPEGEEAELKSPAVKVAGSLRAKFHQGDIGPKPDLENRQRSDATLLVTVRVPSWESLTNAATIEFDQLDTQVARLIEIAGCDSSQRILNEGEVLASWHEIDGRKLASKYGSHHEHLDAAEKFNADSELVTLIRIFSEHEQVFFTHMDSKTHIHVVKKEPGPSGHVGRVTISNASIIKSPAR